MTTTMYDEDLSAFMIKILAKALPVFRESCVLPSLVNTSYSEEAKKQGDEISIPITGSRTTTPVVPGPYAPAAPPRQTRDVKITLDYWEESPLDVTDKVVAEVRGDLFSSEIEQSVKALANRVNATVFEKLYQRSFNMVGTPGTTPFAFPAPGEASAWEAIQAKIKLEDWLAAAGDRYIVMNSTTEGNALTLPVFQYADRSGSGEVLRRGQFSGERLGFEWFKEQIVPSAPATGLSDPEPNVAGAVQPQAQAAIFAKTGLAGSANPGDTFTVAGDPQTYVVTNKTDADSEQVVVSFYPGVQTRQGGLVLDGATGWADGAQVTFTPAHALNFAFQRDAIGCAFRTLKQEGEQFVSKVGGTTQTMVDPVSGIPMRLELCRQHKQVRWSFDLLWGVDAVIPEHICRIVG